MTPREQSAVPTGGVLPPARAARVQARLSGFTGVFVILLAVILLFWPTSRSLVLAWEDTVNLTYTHGYLIFGLSLWLLWRDRANLRAVPVRPSTLATLATLGAGLAWLVVFRAGIDLAAQLMLPVLAWVTVAAVFGFGYAWRCLFAIAFLYFAIPVWDLVNGVLQSVTVVAVEVLLRLTGVPAYIEGNLVHIPAGSFEIAGGCSGLHFLIVGLAIGALYGEVYRDSLRNRILLVVLACALALATNWLRVYIIILAGHLTNMQHYLVSVSHYYFGWAVFLVAILLFALLARLLPVETRPAAATSLGGDASGTGAAGRFALPVLAGVALLAAPVLNLATKREAPTTAMAAAAQVEGPWARAPVAYPPWQPAFTGADSTLHSGYQQGDRYVELYLAAYGSQRQGKEMVSYENSVLGRSALDVLEFSTVEVAGERWQQYRVEDSERRSWLLWLSYEIDRRRFARGLYSQLWYGIASLGTPVVSRAVALRSACVPDCEAAAQTMTTFLHDTRLGAQGEGNR